MKSTALIVFSCLAILVTSSLSGSDFPVAIATDKPGFVISPFEKGRILDVVGIEPGGLAQDPVAKRIFRLPTAPNQPAIPQAKTVRSRDDSPAKIRPDGFAVPGQSDISSNGGFSSHGGSDTSSHYASPREEIEQLMEAFTRSGGNNDPASSLRFMHSKVEDYYGTKWPSHSYLFKDRKNFIKRWPHRSYWMVAPPQIEPNGRGGYTVVRYMGYKVSDHCGHSKRGNVTSVANVVPTASGWKINQVREKR